MGSPLGPNFVNFFLRIEAQLFNNSTTGKSNLHIKCIDDVFAFFYDHRKRERFLNVLTCNSQHQNLKFTIEKATQSLNFLDVEIKILGIGGESLVWCYHLMQNFIQLLCYLFQNVEIRFHYMSVA